MATIKKPVKKYAMGGPMTTTSETTKKPKYVPTAKEKKNLEDASHNRNMRPPFTNEERKKMKNYSNMGSAKSGTTMKKAKSGFAALAPPFDKATFADKIAGAKKNAGKAKSGKTIKKAEEGTNLRKGQYRRLGRIAENNPERAERVAERMNARASRVERGKEIANPPKMEYNPSKIREMLRSEAPKKTMKSGGKMKKCKYGCK
jgi:hypothetical protein